MLLLAIACSAPALGRKGATSATAGRRYQASTGVYLIALASLVSAWPVFGAMEAAARGDDAVLGLFAAPVLALILLRPIARRLQVIAHQQGTLSLPALIGARYGRSPAVAITAALVAASGLGMLLIAEFETVAKAVAVTLGLATNPTLAAVLPGAIAAGTLVAMPGRLMASNGQSTGLVAIARVATTMALAVLVLMLGAALYHGPGFSGLSITPLGSLAAIGDIFGPPPVTSRFLTIVIVATLAVYVLPGRFILIGKSPAGGRRRRLASAMLPVLMILLVGSIIIVAGAGLMQITSSGRVGNHLALSLASSLGPDWLAGIVFGGVLALATSNACLITASVTASLVDEVMAPLRAHRHLARSHLAMRADISSVEKGVAVIYLVLICAVLAAAGPDIDLANTGLIGLAGISLLSPPLLGGLYIRSIKHQGVIAGLVAGTLVWLYTLVVPALSQGSGLASGTQTHSIIGWTATAGAFGLPLSDPLTSGIIWTLIAQIGVMAAVSVNTRASLIERSQADAFADPGRGRRRDRNPTRRRPPTIRVGELDILLRRFLGDQVARETIREYAGERDIGTLAPQLAEPELVRFAENRLASVVGASSARWLLRSGSSRADMDFNDVARVLDRTADAVQFNRGVLRAAIENSDQGISVIDGDLRLVTWNSRYLALFNYPPGLVRTGRHIAELIRYNAERGECGPGEVEDLVQRRLHHLRRGQPHRFERHRTDGKVIYMTGNPIPGGGFVTTFNDITAFKEKQAELARANARLEARVSERTAALSRSNEQLKQENAERARAERTARHAREAAERANQSKNRFLAAASHDLLQPLNAARLFADAASRSPDRIDPASIEKIQNALGSAQALLEPLLDISKIDSGRWPVERDVIAINDVVQPLVDQFRVIAADKGLRLDYVHSSILVETDPNLLRRIVQNLLSNAVRYTETGRIVLGVRRRPQHIEIQIHDTGPGISNSQKTQIFEEFERGDDANSVSDRGLGLGLSLADRLAGLLGHRITVDSTPGRGTCFSVVIATGTVKSPTIDAPSAVESVADVVVNQALVVDDDTASCEALVATLESFGIEALSAEPVDVTDIVNDGVVDALIVDYDLGTDAPNGLELMQACGPNRTACRILASANRDPELVERAAAIDVRVIYKPIDSEALARALGITLTP